MEHKDGLSIVIEDGIQPPEPQMNFKAFLDKLEVGQSFRVNHDYRSRLRNAVTNANRRAEEKAVADGGSSRFYRANKVKERNGEGVYEDFVRVWREIDLTTEQIAEKQKIKRASKQK